MREREAAEIERSRTRCTERRIRRITQSRIEIVLADCQAQVPVGFEVIALEAGRERDILVIAERNGAKTVRVHGRVTGEAVRVTEKAGAYRVTRGVAAERIELVIAGRQRKVVPEVKVFRTAVTR